MLEGPSHRVGVIPGDMEWGEGSFQNKQMSVQRPWGKGMSRQKTANTAGAEEGKRTLDIDFKKERWWGTGPAVPTSPHLEE